MKLLDLFCGAGGAAEGYHRAGFEVVGVDHKNQKNYPFEFIQMDAFKALERFGPYFDVIHASPPCQRYSLATANPGKHPDLYEPIRNSLLLSGVPWIIENVIGAPYGYGFVLCGSMFDLVVRRHRNFETSWLHLLGLRCNHAKQGRPIEVSGHAGRVDGKGTEKHNKGFYKSWPTYMGMEWATPAECSQAIPPAYTEYIGNAMRQTLFKAV